MVPSSDHVYLSTALLYTLSTGSTYTILTGNAGLKYIHPNTSLLCVGSGAVNGLSVAALAENKDRQLTVNDFRIHCLVHPKVTLFTFKAQ